MISTTRNYIQILLAALVLGGALYCGPVAGHPSEYRALWVDTWNEGMLDLDSTRLCVGRAREHRFNTLFVEVSKVMDAYYQSDLLPRADNIRGADFDPLGAVLHYAKPKNPGLPDLEVHAWMVAMRVWKDKPLPDTNLRPAHVMREHPDWISKNHRGARFDGGNYFLDPGHPEVQDFIVNVAKEIVQKYPVDGLHLDYIRYPGNEWGYNEVALERFHQETGTKGIPEPTDELWSAWRRKQVTDIVKRINTEIHAIRPTIKLSAATITWGDVPEGDFKKTRAYVDALQDWIGWLQAGYIDIAVPMNYKRNSDALQARDFVDWVKLAEKNKNGHHHIVGLGAWFNAVEDSCRQCDLARSYRADGIAFFSYNQLEKNGRPNAHVMRDLSRRTLKQPAPVPRADWLVFPRTGTMAGIDPKRRGGYPVYLLDGNGKAVAKARTSAGGHFSFHNLPPGTWRAKVGEASIYSQPVRVDPGRVCRVKF
ncbi:MAG: family 10 glycosylhydrolase [Candidatus Omnitrophica bacterium]|nr:family 10 glycosylhydrolase [Candidatus Omnitrophota bacterium]